MNKIDFELIQNATDIKECAQGLQRFVDQVKKNWHIAKCIITP